MPKRIQMKRTKGWRKPAGAIYVGRPSRDGNPFRIGEDLSYYLGPTAKRATAAQCVEIHRTLLEADCKASPDGKRIMCNRLRGHDLACWCRLDQPCHADTLLELANR